MALMTRELSLVVRKFTFRPIRTFCLKRSGIEENLYTPKFTVSEQNKILKIVNESDADQLSKYNISAKSIKHLSAYKNKQGPFQSLNEILEVDGLGIKVLERICENIIQDKVDLVPNKKLIGGVNKRLRNLLIPSLSDSKLISICSVVGVHLGPTGASWAKLNKEGNRLEKWNRENFTSLPTKMLPTDTYDLALSILGKIPVSDVYIFESSAKNLLSQSQSIITGQHLELTSMLLALLNTSPNHNMYCQPEIGKCFEMSNTVFPNAVHFVKNNLPARLFKTFIGHEKVSTVNIVTDLLNNGALSAHSELVCSPISVDTSLVNEYNSKSPPDKELLGQALILAISFMDIWIYKNAASIAEVTLHKRKN